MSSMPSRCVHPKQPTRRPHGTLIGSYRGRSRCLCRHGTGTCSRRHQSRRGRLQNGNVTQHPFLRPAQFMPQSDPAMIKEIINAVTIPVMAKIRIGHFVEAQVRLTCVLSSS